MENLFSGKSALILDKKLEDLQSLRTILGNLGFGEVQVASSVNMALSMLREQSVDFCFMCYELGRDEKNGLQLLLELQAESLRLYTASYVLVIDPEKSELLLGSPENAPDIYISKPYDTGRLRQSLEKLLRMKESLRPVEELLDQNALEQALVQCELQQQRYPGLKVYLQRLTGIIQLRSGHSREALTLFSNLLEGRDEPWIRVAMAIAACQCGRFPVAREQLDHVLGRQQVCIEAFVWRARLHRLCGEIKEAQVLLRRAVTLQPTVAVLQGDLANLSVMSGDIMIAMGAFRAAIRFSRYSALQHPDYYFGLVRLLLTSLHGTRGSEAQDEAIRVLEQVQRDFLDMPVIHFKARLLSSEVYRAAKETQRADRMAVEAMQLFTELSLDDQAMWLDQLLEGVESTPAAESARSYRQELTRKMVALSWGRANLKGMMQFRNGEMEEAFTSFSGAQAKMPGNPSIGLNLVQCALELLKRGGDRCELLSVCDEALYGIQYAALTPRQQQRYLALGKRLADYVVVDDRD